MTTPIWTHSEYPVDPDRNALLHAAKKADEELNEWIFGSPTATILRLQTAAKEVLESHGSNLAVTSWIRQRDALKALQDALDSIPLDYRQ